MSEIHFIVEKAAQGGFTARAVGADIFAEADDLPGLHAQVEDAVHCHFDEGSRPAPIRLHLHEKLREAPVPNRRPVSADFCEKDFEGSSGELCEIEDKGHEHDVLRA